MNPPRLSPLQWRIANVGLIFGIGFFLIYYLTGFHRTLFTNSGFQSDFIQWHHYPPIFLEKLAYPSDAFGQWTHPFPYLPSAIVMFLPLSWLPRLVAFALWMVMQAGAVIAIVWIALRMSGGDRLPERFLIALLAILLTDNPLSWDLRTHNNNLIYLALVMFGLVARPMWLGGVLLAMSANLKLYSGPLLAVLVWRRERCLAIAMTVAGLIIAIVPPILVFGPSGFVQLLVGWVGQVDFRPPPGVAATLPPDAFRLSAATLSGTSVTSSTAAIVVWVMRAIWIAAVLAYFIVATRRAPAIMDGRARLADASIILLAPLPFSNYFVPYHAVPLLPAYALLLTAAFEPARPRRERVALGVLLVATQLIYYSTRRFDLRGVLFLAVFMLVAFGLGMVRKSLAPP